MIYCSIFLHNHFIIQVIPREKPFSFRQKVTNFNVEKRKELNWRNSTWCQWWGCAGRRRENKHHQRAHVGYPSGRLWGSHHCKEGPRPEFCTARGKWKWWINTPNNIRLIEDVTSLYTIITLIIQLQWYKMKQFNMGMPAVFWLSLALESWRDKHNINWKIYAANALVWCLPECRQKNHIEAHLWTPNQKMKKPPINIRYWNQCGCERERWYHKEQLMEGLQGRREAGSKRAEHTSCSWSLLRPCSCQKHTKPS